jgi:hypothetical protein
MRSALAAALAALVLYHPAQASISCTAGAIHQNGSGASTTVAVTTTIPSGAAILVTIGWAGVSGQTFTVADGGDTFISPPPAGYLVNTSFNYNTASTYALNSAGGSLTITGTLSGTYTFASIIVDYCTGVASSAALDGSSAQIQNSLVAATNVSSGSATSTVNGDLVYGSTVNIAGNGTVSADTGFTGLASVANKFQTEYQVQSTAGATAATFTHSATDGFNTSMIILKDAAGGGSTCKVGGLSSMGAGAC